MTYNSDTKNQKIIKNKNLGSYSLNVNVKNHTTFNDLSINSDNKMPETKRKPFKIPDHIFSIECNKLFY